MGVDFTHAPDACSWVESAAAHPEFPVQNLPLGIFTPPASANPRGGVAIGDEILDLPTVANMLEGEAKEAAALANADSLNALLASGKETLRALRQGVFRLLTDVANQAAVSEALYPASDCTLHLPVKVNDYTDFYTGIHHAENVGKQFRPDNPLLPNYKYVPIGYHGRSSSIRISGEGVKRPLGQTKAPDQDVPDYGPCKKLDYELEMAIWIGRGNDLGNPVSIAEADQHIAGISILNDWSARDIQAWEYQPLGPFLAKNFHSTVSPWIITMDALAPFRVAQPARPEGDPRPLAYLLDEADQAEGALSVTMKVSLSTTKMRENGLPPTCLSRGVMAKNMYWTPAQLVTHHASNGCNLASGDLLGTGTLSGASEDSMGSLMEISRGGKQPLDLLTGETRSFLEAGDEVIMTAFAEAPNRSRIGFGECRARILD